jgi:bifunctional DNase/RNase
MIPVEIANVAVLDKRFIIFLKSENDERVLPIFIDEQQAQSIIVQINHVEIPRPLTHDLFKTVLDSLGCRIARIEVSEVREDTFYARLVVEGNGNSFDFDARPSDAICLALRFGAPMFVHENVMDKAGIIMEKSGTDEAESLDELRPEESPLDALKRKLEQAIKEERYEEAARLRDEINKMTKAN